MPPVKITGGIPFIICFSQKKGTCEAKDNPYYSPAFFKSGGILPEVA